jgi:NAD(P)-dependent dehydrogenase (short-subunit alcohol dehydrogenase family)
VVKESNNGSETGKRVLIAAAASGIGLAIARDFAAQGAKVHVCDINEDALRALKQSDPSITSTLCDVSDRSSVERLVADATHTLGGLDVLVNNGATGVLNVNLSTDEPLIRSKKALASLGLKRY